MCLSLNIKAVGNCRFFQRVNKNNFWEIGKNMSLLLNDCIDADYFDACKELQDKYGIPAKPYMTIHRNGKWKKNTGHWQRQRGIAYTSYT